MKPTIKLKESDDLDILIKDEKGNPGLISIFFSNGMYKADLFQDRIYNPNACNYDIYEGLSLGKKYGRDFQALEDAVVCGLDFWLLPTPENILDQEAHVVTSLAEGIRMLNECSERYLFLFVDNEALKSH